ncbi:MAG: tetratricopeptide repeat-containing sensor histidine kinase [Chitinophagaceae bacterium]
MYHPKYTAGFLLSCGLLLLFVIPSSAQLKSQAKLDSLLNVLQQQKEDSSKVKTLANIALYYHNANPLKAFPYIHEALALAKKLEWKEGIATQYSNVGGYLNDTGNYPLARTYYDSSYKLSLALGNKKGQVQIFNQIGRSYLRESNYPVATDYLLKALALAEEIKDNEQIGIISTNLAGFYITQKNYAKAEEYAEVTERYVTMTNNVPHIIQSQVQLGLIKAALKDTTGAKLVLEKALKRSIDNNDPVDEANVLVNLSYLCFPDYKKAIGMMERVKTILDSINPSSVINIANMANLGDAYVNIATTGPAADKKMYLEKATTNLLRAKSMAEQSKNVEYLADIYNMLSKLEEVKGNYQLSLDNFKQFTHINDSLFSQEKKNEIAGLEGKHSIAVKDQELALNKLTLSNQRKTQWGLIAGVALLAIIGGLLYFQSANRKKTNQALLQLNTELDAANKVKARFFSILSHDLRSPIVNLVHFLHLQKESPDLLSQQQQTNQRQNISDAAENLLQNMETMLLWSKEQMGNFAPHIKDVPVKDLFSYLQSFFTNTTSFSITYTAMPGLLVKADENYLRTIMQNLTSNAIRAVKNIPAAAIEWQAKKQGDKTILLITDNGPGIDAEQVKALFDDSVSSNQGTGLGLHLVRDLAKAIQYRIEVKSVPAQGTTFILSPLA